MTDMLTFEEKEQEINSKIDIIAKIEFGSKLYGTSNEDSDTDYKIVFLPSREELLLGKVKHSYKIDTKENPLARNTKEDIDIEYMSLQKFLGLACEGQTIAIDMMHASDSYLKKTTLIWEFITDNKKMFYTKNLNAFTEYCRKQAAKYAIKSSRLHSAKALIEFLKGKPLVDRLKDHWEELPQLDHLNHLENTENDIAQFEICGRTLQSTITIEYALTGMQSFLDKYGQRVREAEQNKNVDWKAVSHAVRAAYQCKEIFESGDLKYPLKDAEQLKIIKSGKLDYMKEVAPLLESLMDEVEALAKQSNYPEDGDFERWKDFIFSVMEDHVLRIQKVL